MSNKQKFLPLGAAQEVGRSCFYLQFKRAKYKGAFMLDCGINPSISEGNLISEIPALPYFDILTDKYPQIEFILISHYHTDHFMGLPYLFYQLQKKNQLCPIYMTSQTKREIERILTQYHNEKKLLIFLPEQERKEKGDEILNLIKNKIEIIDYDQTKIDQKTQVKIKALPAGHVTGACMFSIDINNYKILYTGDFSLESNRYIEQARIDEQQLRKCDLLITESTCGTITFPSRSERISLMLNAVEQSLSNQGSCLFPVFNVGIVEELIKIVVDFLEKNFQKFQNCKCILSGIQYHIPENMKRFVEIQNKNQIEVRSGNIFFASPAMLQSGKSYEIFKRMCSSSQNSLIITSYASKDSYLYYVMKQSKEKAQSVKLQDKQNSDFKIRVFEFSFNAHADFEQLMRLIESYEPKNIILVHGSQKASQNLYQELKKKYNVKNPRLGEEVTYQIEQGVIVNSQNKLNEGEENKFLIKQQGVGIKISEYQEGKIPYKIVVKINNAKYQDLKKNLQKKLGQDNVIESKEQKSLQIKPQIFDIIYGNVNNFKNFCLNQYVNDQEDKELINIKFFKDNNQKEEIKIGDRERPDDRDNKIVQSVIVEGLLPKQIDYVQKILQILVNNNNSVKIDQINQILNGKIQNQQIILEQYNDSIVYKQDGFWIVKGDQVPDSLYQIVQSINSLIL